MNSVKLHIALAGGLALAVPAPASIARQPLVSPDMLQNQGWPQPKALLLSYPIDEAMRGGIETCLVHAKDTLDADDKLPFQKLVIDYFGRNIVGDLRRSEAGEMWGVGRANAPYSFIMMRDSEEAMVVENGSKSANQFKPAVATAIRRCTGEDLKL